MTEQETPQTRWVGLDWMRGWVMVLMALDHASMFYNAGRVASDSVLMYKNTALPLQQFLLRWVTHLCAPTFMFLAGAAIALSVAKRQAKAATPWQIDRHLLIRGGILILLDLTYFSSFISRPFLQVLYAIGSCMLLIIPLRRLPLAALAALAVGWMAFGEGLTLLLWDPAQGNSPIALAPILGYYKSPDFFVLYPTLPWLPVMLLGWILGTMLPRLRAAGRERLPRILFGMGVLSLALFGLVRGMNGYGNFGLFRLDGSLAQWLHVNKYPPSLSFLTLELGLMALLLAACFWLEPRVKIRTNGPILVFGQTALFFYLLHFPVLHTFKVLISKGGIPTAFLATALALVLLYPICRWYRGYKQAHPRSWVRFL